MDESIYIHAIERAAQRLGLSVDLEAFNGWRDQVRQGRSRLLRVHPNGCEDHEVSHEGRAVRVVFDPKGAFGRGSIITTLDDRRPPIRGRLPSNRDEYRREARRKQRLRWIW